MNVAASLHSSMPNLVSLKGYPIASPSRNIGNTQNKRNSKNNLTYNIMNKSNLSKLTKDQLIELLLKKETPVPLPRNKLWRKQETPTPLPRKKKVIPIQYPRKSVRQMIQNYENNIIQPPKQFADKPIAAPKTKKITPLMDIIIPPPKQFADRPIISPRMKTTSAIPLIRKRMKKIPPTPLPRTEITETARAFQGFTKSYQVGIKNDKDPLVQLNTTRLAVAHFMKQLLPRIKGLKFIETLTISCEQQRGNQIVSRIGYFNSKPKTIINADDLTPFLDVNVEQIMEDIHKWISQGSAWLIKSINGHFINIIQYEPLAGSSFIQLPTELQHKKKGIINLQNKDNECFRWCHVRHLNPRDDNPQRIKKTDKSFVKQLNYDGIEFPVSIKQYNKIETQNSININVFGYENKQPYPIFISKEKFDDQLNLLLISENEKTHYCLIQDFNRFMFNQTKHKNKKHFCMHCLQCFSSERVLTNHKEVCLEINGKQAIKMPKVGSKIGFQNFKKQLQVPFVIYADFEAITEKISGCQKSNEQSFTEAYQKHTDCGYGYKVVCCYDDKYTKPIQYYRGEKAVYKFMESMLNEVKYCKKILKTKFNKPLKMTPDDENDFQTATSCHICGKKYIESDVRVRDHCHVTGKYRGSAHESCNLNFQLTDKIPVIFHNLKGYDSHFITQEIGSIIENNTFTDKKGQTKKHKINVIPHNMEKYMTFMLGNYLAFIDSLQFMNQSLSNVAKNLPEEAFKHTKQVFKDDKFKLMKQKGVYPYDYMDSFEKFNETQLPSQNDFFSQMNNEHITDEEYNHAQTVWDTFELKTMGEYHDLYLQSDVLLLAA